MWDFDSVPASRQVQPTRVLTPFVNRIAGLQPIVALHTSCDGRYFVVCPEANGAALVQCSGKQGAFCALGERGMVDVVRCKGHCAALTSSSSHGREAHLFYTAAQDGTARLWDVSTLEQRSSYVVKHGSGQIDDTVVVDCVLGLSGRVGVGGQGALFLTGGANGCVQLWDTRTRHRPGGACATWDVYADDVASAPASTLCGTIEMYDTALHVSAHNKRGWMNRNSVAPPFQAEHAAPPRSSTPCATQINVREGGGRRAGGAGANREPWAVHERHVGGMAELSCGPRGASEESHHGTHASAMQIAVRTGNRVAVWDFRQSSRGAVTTTAAAAAASCADWSAVRVWTHEEALPLATTQDTSSLVARGTWAASSSSASSLSATVSAATRPRTATSRPGGFFAATGSSGYRHRVGGHVVWFEGPFSSSSPPPSSAHLHVTATSAGGRGASAWPVGKAAEGVMSLAVDTAREDGCVYAGLDSGAVAVLGLHASRGAQGGGGGGGVRLCRTRLHTRWSGGSHAGRSVRKRG